MPELVKDQVQGRDWLAVRDTAILGDVPGLGKSAQALRAAVELGAQRVLVASPAVARVNWERECVKWGVDLPIVRVTDKGDHRTPHPHAPQLVILSYDGLASSKVLRGHVNAGLWDVAILDEAHRLKTPDSRRTKSVYGTMLDARQCLAGKAMHTWLLSGSIMPNHAGELWTHLHALWPHLIRSPAGHVMDQIEFMRRYCILQFNDYGMPKVLGYRDRDGLIALLQQIMLRRENIEGLPGVVIREEPVLVEVDDKQLLELESHEEFDDLRAVLNSANARANDLAGIEDEFIHLPTLRRLTGRLKAKGAAEVIGGELAEGDKVLVFAMHREALEVMWMQFTAMGANPAMVHGGIPDGQRNDEIDRFQEDPACRVFLGQVQACQEAITLTAGNRIWIVEAPWSPEYLDQLIRRARRRGQQKTCFVRFLAIAGSIDEMVARCSALKAQNIGAIMQAKYDGATTNE